MSNVNTVVFTIVLVLFLVVTVVGLPRGPLAPPAGNGAPETNGDWRAAASARSSRGSCSAATSTPPTRSSPCRAVFRLGFDRLLRGLLHDHGVPDRVHLPAQAVVDLPGAQLGSHQATSSGAGTAHAGWRWPWPSPASWR